MAHAVRRVPRGIATPRGRLYARRFEMFASPASRAAPRSRALVLPPHAARTTFQSGGIARIEPGRIAEPARPASRARANPTRRMRERQRHAHRT
ncbi:hypothetical protein EZV77_23155 [Burkholderia thailandensis]|nr:hypothetical protein A8H32_15975 [Burkholderia thailandensis]PJO73473.1 hypothetical protein CWD92_04965 [Burkholderia thailandensis]PNE73547.1 hypothetical protein A8H37_16275 [Burkholderia thailandensis]TBW58354.1 hypothetical protein EZV77_23155 [Burkholderia thailandensis]TGB30984.1 hypothetical protein C6946_25580 [Burkholderia thailandensis]